MCTAQLLESMSGWASLNDNLRVGDSVFSTAFSPAVSPLPPIAVAWVLADESLAPKCPRIPQVDTFGCAHFRHHPHLVYSPDEYLRGELIAKIVSTLPNEISIVRRGGRWRSRLRLTNGLIFSVLVARSVRTWKETLWWLIDPVRHESKFITLLARLDSSNRSFLDLYVFPYIDRQTRFLISLRNAWLNRGKRLSELSRLCEVVVRVRRARKSEPRKSNQRT